MSNTPGRRSPRLPPLGPDGLGRHRGDGGEDQDHLADHGHRLTVGSPFVPDLDAVIARCREGHRRLFDTLDGLDDEAVRDRACCRAGAGATSSPTWPATPTPTSVSSPGPCGARPWSSTRAASRSECGHRDGLRPSRRELAADVRAAALRLEDTWAAMAPEAWDGHGLARGRVWPCRELPSLRWREVEVHHGDLGLGYEWPDDYLAHELPVALAGLPDRLPEVGDRRRLLGVAAGPVRAARQPRHRALAAVGRRPWRTRSSSPSTRSS